MTKSANKIFTKINSYSIAQPHVYNNLMSRNISDSESKEGFERVLDPALIPGFVTSDIPIITNRTRNNTWR